MLQAEARRETLMVPLAEEMPVALITGGSPDDGKKVRSMRSYEAPAGAAGALIGAMVGHAFSSERWEPAPLEGLH